MFYQSMTGVQAVDAAFVPKQGGACIFQLQGPGGTFSWNGVNSNGQTVASGVYTVEFTEATSAAPLNFVVQATVLTLQSQSNISIFNSAGELVRYFPLLAGSAGNLQLSTDKFVPREGDPGVKISWGTAGTDSLYWNGQSGQGALVASGVYLVQITTQTTGSPSVTTQAYLKVLQWNTSLLSGVFVAPNPLGRGQNLVVFAPGLQASDSLSIGLYSLAGQWVVSAYGHGSGLQMVVPTSISGGIYLAVLRAHSESTGAIERKVFKVAVAH